MILIRQRGAVHVVVFLALSMILLSMPTMSHAQSAGSCGATGSSASTIMLDGQFSDWAGQPCISDPADDCQNDRVDLVSFFFTTVPNDPTAYFMAETASGANQPLGLRLQIDTDNDGIYTSAVDRIVLLRYQPNNNGSGVDVDLLDGQEGNVAEIAHGANWGESQEGNHVEWGVSLAQLGVQAGQPLRMVLASQGGNDQGNSWCDETQEVQWSPADALGPALLLVIVLGVAVLAARRRVRLP
jgi:hypothetical protein